MKKEKVEEIEHDVLKYISGLHQKAFLQLISDWRAMREALDKYATLPDWPAETNLYNLAKIARDCLAKLEGEK